jgi:RHS repeat-associated protein
MPSATCAATVRFLPSRSTGKERDTESGNDYFGARYYASTMGRWLSPDTDTTLKRILPYPQRWNRYAYVINNPLVRFDPDGLADFYVYTNYGSKDFPVKGTARPNWAAIQAAAQKNGHHVYFRNASNGQFDAQHMTSDLGQKGAFVLSSGHTLSINPGQTPPQGIALGSGDLMGSRAGVDPMVASSMTPFPAAQSAAVALFGCSSFSLSDQFPNTTFVGISGGGGFSNSLTDEQAQAAFLTSATSKSSDQPVDVDAATAAANSVVQNSTNLVQVPGGPPINIDKGETVQEKKP